MTSLTVLVDQTIVGAAVTPVTVHVTLASSVSFSTSLSVTATPARYVVRSIMNHESKKEVIEPMSLINKLVNP